jgi:hypothetical protein
MVTEVTTACPKRLLRSVSRVARRVWVAKATRPLRSARPGNSCADGLRQCSGHPAVNPPALPADFWRGPYRIRRPFAEGGSRRGGDHENDPLALACVVPLLAGCGRSSDGPTTPADLIGEMPSDARPSGANGGTAGTDERAVAWFATNPFQGRRVEFPVVLNGGENGCSVHPLESHTPGCVTLNVIAQPVTLFG